MCLHRRKSLYRALTVEVLEVDHHTLRTAPVCCCEFLRQYFLWTLSHLSWLQWALNNSKLSLQESSEISFCFCLQNFGTKCLSKVNLCHWIYISFPVINSRFKQALVFFWPPDIVNFHLKSLFVITLVQSKQICSFDAGDTHTHSIVLVGMKPILSTIQVLNII